MRLEERGTNDTEGTGCHAAVDLAERSRHRV